MERKSKKSRWKIGRNNECIKTNKREAEKAGDANKDIGKRTKKTDDHMTDKIITINTQNKILKELINKIRSSDKICVDITLILILLVLICVLYSIIKHKY